ncbi:hypothetical protein Bhyg_04557, partial [Pseudolycoriella hygida]
QLSQIHCRSHTHLQTVPQTVEVKPIVHTSGWTGTAAQVSVPAGGGLQTHLQHVHTVPQALTVEPITHVLGIAGNARQISGHIFQRLGELCCESDCLKFNLWKNYSYKKLKVKTIRVSSNNMGGNWTFALVGDPSTIDVKKYQEELLKIHNRYRWDPKLFENVRWFLSTEAQKKSADNIFAKFTYKCKRHTDPFNCHRNEPGVDGSQNAWWVLYWDPSKAPNRYDAWGDIFARCSPRDFIYKSITMQRHLAINFPEHFRVWLSDDVDGCGDRELYWGVKPEHLNNHNSDSDADSDVDAGPPTSEDEWFLETI